MIKRKKAEPNIVTGPQRWTGQNHQVRRSVVMNTLRALFDWFLLNIEPSRLTEPIKFDLGADL